jgi:hypothetical protein
VNDLVLKHGASAHPTSAPLLVERGLAGILYLRWAGSASFIDGRGHSNNVDLIPPFSPFSLFLQEVVVASSLGVFLFFQTLLLRYTLSFHPSNPLDFKTSFWHSSFSFILNDK